MLRDYKPFIGREVSLFTGDGSIAGELVAVGRHTLTVKASVIADERGESVANRPKGVVMVEASAITWVQVR